MIIFHEGLPRSGKSYEAMVRRILPALQNGRGVTAYIEGLDHDKIANLAGISPERCRDLLKTLTIEQAPEWFKHARKNDLVVLDEIQDYHGVRAKLSAEATKAVTQHGHLGQDIVLMGQDYKDANVIWRRRIEIKLAFLKLTGVGQENAYSVTTWRHKGGDEYDKVNLSVQKYDPKYFGTYASHVASDVQTGNYKESRANALHAPLIKYGLPVALIAGLWGAWYTWGFFHGTRGPAARKVTSNVAAPAPIGASSSPTASGATAAAKAVDKRSPVEKRFADLSGQYRIRLAGLIRTGERFSGVVEWVDPGQRVQERQSLDTLRQMGVAVAVGDSFVRLQVGDWQDIATMWPLQDPIAAISQDRLQAMRPAAAQPGTDDGLISLGHDAPAPAAAPAPPPVMPGEGTIIAPRQHAKS